MMASSQTTGRCRMVPTARIAIWGRLTTGEPKRPPRTPRFVIVKVPSWTSLARRRFERARSARSRTARAIPRKFLWSALDRGENQNCFMRPSNADVHVSFVYNVCALDRRVKDWKRLRFNRRTMVTKSALTQIESVVKWLLWRQSHRHPPPRFRFE
jgi:hypothetical protein